MFTYQILSYKQTMFDELLNSVVFETINNGRMGANLVDYKNNLIPIVRTTTSYNNTNQAFKEIHYDIIKDIEIIANSTFNNALIEVYNNKYKNMKYHSDQSLDLSEESYICIYSCYKNYIPLNNRILVIKHKITNVETEYELKNNSIIMFSKKTNDEYLHKIISKTDNDWLGITFRQSKTFIYFINEIPYFYNNNNKLTLANNDERKKMYQYKYLQNTTYNYNYPEIYYTLSVGDIRR